MIFDTVKQNLEEKGYNVSCFATAEEAVDYIDSVIDNKTVGFGGSVTLDQIGLYDILSTHNKVYWHQKDKAYGVKEKASNAEIYISSINGIAETGEIINIDGVCNRVASILYGHKKVFLVAGKNKLAKDYESALWRARNIAAPLNAKRLGMNTPCAKNADKCYDCKSKDRICRALSVLWSKTMLCDFEVVLINQDLGY